ncbi:hypothetical protein BDY17DRAFT_231072, partial [Neohortaea acidophila]
QRPLYLFDLPEELLYTLQLKLQPTAAPAPDSSAPSTPSQSPSPSQDATTVSATSCSLCSLSFATLQDQRNHVRSDLHGYNLKQKMRARKPVTEQEFERLVGELDESISGSDTTESDESDTNDANGTKDTTLSALLKRQAKLADGDAEDAPASKRKKGSGVPPLIWFTSSTLPPNTSLGVYRAIFSTKEQAQPETLPETIKQKQLSPKPPPKQRKAPADDDEGGVALPPSMLQQGTSASGPHYFLCMIGGGHFAAMLVSLTPKLTKKNGVEDRSATVIAHKTFHRYTTRRKQGGSQSANDNSKGNAHSAGSSIRRHNEVALTLEVRELLAQWKQLIDSADLLFIRASGTTNRRTLFGPYEAQVLSSRDDRIRGFPFNTRRATQAELMRAFVELTRVKQAEEEAAAAAAAAYKPPSTPPPSKATQPKPSKAEEEATHHTTQLQALIRRSKAPALLTYLQTNTLSPNFPFHPQEAHHHAPTPLHLASSLNSPPCITALLLKANADPTIRNQEEKSPFDIAGDRPSRDAFRLARHQLGEEKWPWDAAGVAPALSPSDVEARSAREAQDKAAEDAAEKARREAEVRRLREADAEKKDARFGRGNVLENGGKARVLAMTAEERRREEAKGMSEEMRVKLEREKRARAAEERMRRFA